MSDKIPTTEQVRDDYAFVQGSTGYYKQHSKVVEFDRWLKQVKAEIWKEARNAEPQYLGPDDGHYEGCMGWDDCYCACYPNPYLEGEQT